MHHKLSELEVQDSDSDSEGSSLSFDSLSSIDNKNSETRNAETRTEDTIAGNRLAIELKEHVEDTIVRLHGHALQIDRTAAKHRRERLKLYQQRDETKLDYEAYKRIGLLRGAKVHFHSASEALQERMADLLARRRVRFDYLEKHQRKRAYNAPNQQPGLSVASRPIAFIQGTRSETSSSKYQDATTSRSPPAGRLPKDQKSIYSTTVDTRLVMSSVVRQQKRSESVISIAQEHPDFVPPPKIEGASFHCPYCQLDFRASEAKGAHWMYVLHDKRKR